MNKFLSVLVVFLTTNAFAAGAQNYVCGGTLTTPDRVVPISFEVNYSDWVQGKGYTSEMLNVTAPATAVTGLDLAIFKKSIKKDPECFSLVEL